MRFCKILSRQATVLKKNCIFAAEIKGCSFGAEMIP